MSEQTTISLPKSVKEKLDKDRPETQTWGNYLWSLHENGDVHYGHTSGEVVEEIREKLDTIETAQAGTVNEALKLAEPDDLRDQLDRIESAAETAEERTGSIENTLENMGGR